MGERFGRVLLNGNPYGVLRDGRIGLVYRCQNWSFFK